MPLPQDIQHLAILMPSWLGDIVMASSVWQIARKQYPNAIITAVARPHLAPLLETIDVFDDVLSLDMKNSVFKSGKILKRIKADAIILLPNSIRSALIAKLASIPNRCGYKRDWRSWLLTESVSVGKSTTPTPTTSYYLKLANAIFGTNEMMATPSLGEQNKNLFFDEQHKPIVLLVAGASKARKRWAPEQFAKVADALSDMGATCFCIGAPHEYNLVQQIADSANSNVYNLIDKEIPLGSLPSLIAQADLMITNDTGPRHIAVATGVPVITLYGPTDYRWTEYECKNDVPVLADPFLPIQYVADEHPEQCDIQKIPASDVIELAKQFIR